MATPRAKKTPPRMAHVSIGLVEILVPADLAGKLIDLLAAARVCRRSYFDDSVKAGGQLQVEMKLLPSSAKIVEADLDDNGFDVNT